MLQDFRIALRTLGRAPGFFTLSVATLALGVGVTTVLFSVTESVLWRPLAFPDSERLAAVSELNLKHPSQHGNTSAPDFLDWRARARSFESLAASDWGGSHNVSGAGFSERMHTRSVSAGFFETLDVRPAFGRTFRRDEERAGSRAVLLSNDVWRRAFKASPNVLGTELKIDDEPYTIVGVMPPFQMEIVSDPDVFLPLNLAGDNAARNRRDLAVIGRLRNGVSLGEAGAEMQSVAKTLAIEHPRTNANWGAQVENLRRSYTVYSQHMLLVFLGFSALVLLIACANVAALVVVRFVARHKELALRTALGASRGALLRLALTESLCIALPGSMLGTLLAAWGTEGVRRVLPPDFLIRADQISIDARALAFVLAVSIATTFFFALAPGMLARSSALDTALKDWGKSVSGAPRSRRRMDALVAAEVALAFVLLFAAGLFLSSHLRLERLPLGFDPHSVLTMRIAPGGKGLTGPDEQRTFYRRALDRVASAPGIREAAVSVGLPLQFAPGASFCRADGPRPAHGDEPYSLARAVSPSFFHIMGIRLLEGRAFTEQDSATAPRVAIVNQNLARSIFGGESPVGKSLEILNGGDPSIPPGPVQIIGLAPNIKEVGLDEIPFKDIYLPFAQNPASSAFLVAKMDGPAETAAPTVRRELGAIDPSGAVYSVHTMEELTGDALRGERFHLRLIWIFAALAALLAGVGVYGAISFSVAQRTREFGVRMALGANPAAIVVGTVVRTARLTFAGSAAGLGIALVVGQLTKKALYLAPGEHSGIIYGVGIHDPASFAGAGLVILALAAAAGIFPASRASKVDPASALRHE